MDAVASAGQATGRKQGKLTIFASYFSGAGKSYAMLESAREAKQAGLDVAIGILSDTKWPKTTALAEQFEILPCKKVARDGHIADEIDLDACLKRHPQLIVIEDLSHWNADACRHMKRYQDIEELRKAGMDVYTTLDIHHIESIQDTVFSILGTSVPERIPDRVFDQADQVEFIDLEPQRLRQRLMDGQKEELLEGCSLSQLSALREVGLRRCADRAALYTQEKMQTEYRTHEHILVCLSSAPSNEKIIRTAARMAGAFRCGFTALFVETKAFQWMNARDKQRLQGNMRLAQQLGASIETVYGDDVAYQIAEFSRLSGVTKIVLGRSGIPHRLLLRKTSLTERLIELTPELDIHIIPDNGANRLLETKHREVMHMPSISVLDLLKSAGILILVTLIGLLFYNFGFTEANIITLYILGVMLISVYTRSSICSLVASIASVLTFNFLFTVPRFTLQAYDSEYPITFLVMFLASLLTGSLASKLKSHAKRSAQVAWRTKLLFETSQNLQRTHTQEEIISVTAKQLLKIFQRDIVVYPMDEKGLLEPEIFLVDGAASPQRYTTAKEREVAQWVLSNNKRAGVGTETLPDALCTYLSIRTGERVYGVVGIAASEKPLDSFESSILLSVLGECALALENQKNVEEKEAAAVLAKNEQLRANLLRSISHDLRTPLTSISGNASNLLSNESVLDADTRRQMYEDIYDDALWLTGLVENLLYITRIEDKRLDLELRDELVSEVVQEAVKRLDRKAEGHVISVVSDDDFVFARMDARLVVQVLINLLTNAVKYTPEGSHITVRTAKDGDRLRISVEDDGPGIPDEEKNKVFDMFYSAGDRSTHGARSIGLGLYLCRAIISAHGSELRLKDNDPHGSIFYFELPVGEVNIHG